jgi:hypothetical protein
VCNISHSWCFALCHNSATGRPWELVCMPLQLLESIIKNYTECAGVTYLLHNRQATPPCCCAA